MRTKKMTGSVRPRPSKEDIRYYDIVLELGMNKETGKRERITFRADTTDKKEAEAQLEIKKLEYIQGEMLMPSELTVAQYLDEYLQDWVEPQNSPATYRDYEQMIERYLKPEFGKIKLQALKRSRVQQVYNEWKKKSPASNQPLKATTIKHINRIFKAALNVACDLGYIKENPTDKTRIGKDLNTNPMDVYTIEEIRELQKAVKGTDMELPVALLFDCVMRRGELLGLCYSDIDFEKGTVTIQHALVESRDSKVPILKDCKTSSSYRKIVVSDYTMKLLKHQRVKYKENKLRYGEKFCDSNRVICQKNGAQYLPKSFTHKWAETLKKYGLRHIKLHGTRHSAISMLVSEGVPLHMVQQRAGHQGPEITLSVYAHVAKDNESVVAEKLDSMIFSAVNQ